jgi:hypothetical protein
MCAMCDWRTGAKEIGLTDKEIGAAGLMGDGWVRLSIPGWKSHEVHVFARIVDGEKRVLGLRLLPRKDTTLDEAVLTSNRLRALPIQAIASTAVAMTRLDLDGVERQLRALAARPMAKHDKRAAAAVEAVADLWNTARAAGQAPRAAVCEHLHISARTADRYISKARAAGLLDQEGTPE